MKMTKVRPMPHFDYSNEKVVVADMDGRDKSYLYKLVVHMNKMAEAHNELVDAVRAYTNSKDEDVRIDEQKEADKQTFAKKQEKETAKMEELS